MNEPADDKKPASVSIGSCLRYERAKRGLSIEAIAKETRLSTAVIKSLEEDNYDRLPSQQVYIRGYIRSYCAALEIDAGALLGEQLNQTREPEEEHDSMTTEYHYRLIRIWGSLAVVSAITVLVFLWWSERPAPMPEKTPAVQTAPAEESSSAPGPVFQPENRPHRPLQEAKTGRESPADHQASFDGAAAAGEHSAVSSEPGDEVQPVSEPEPVQSYLTIRTSDRCWTYISDNRNRVIISKLLPSGYGKTVQGYAPFKVRLGNARAVDLWLNGEKQDLSPYLSDFADPASFVLGQPAPE